MSAFKEREVARVRAKQEAAKPKPKPKRKKQVPKDDA